MNKFKFLATAVVASMLAFAPSTALAAGTEDVSLQINGNDIDLASAKPVIVENRVYVPFRAVFETLEAKVSFDETTKKITAVKDDTTVELTIGDKNIVVTKNGASATVETDATSFISSNNLTYVPVRFAAQSLDCLVGWDADNKTAIIVENDLFSLEGITFDLANKYTAYANEFSNEKYEIDGNFKFDMVMSSATTGTENDIKLPGDIVITGVTDSKTLNMDMIMKLNFDEFKALMDEAESEEELSALENIEMNMIFDMEAGKFYLASPLFATLVAAEENTWYLLDFNEVFKVAGMDFTDLMKMSKEADFSKYLAIMTEDIPVDNKIMTATYIKSYKLLIDMFADQAFTQKGDEYTSVSVMTEAGSTVKTTLTLITSDDKVTGYKMTMGFSADGMGEIMTMDMSQKELASTMKMTMNMAGMMTMNMDGTINYKKTTNTPISKPASGKVVDLAGMFTGAFE